MKSLLVIAILSLSTSAFAQTIATAATPEALGKLWAHAIQQDSTDELKPLLHPGCTQGDIKSAILNRMVSGGLPANYTFEVEDMTTPAEQLDKIFLVRPEKNLIIHYLTSNEDDKHRYGIGKGFPIAQKDGRWYFAICKK